MRESCRVITRERERRRVEFLLAMWCVLSTPIFLLFRNHHLSSHQICCLNPLFYYTSHSPLLYFAWHCLLQVVGQLVELCYTGLGPTPTQGQGLGPGQMVPPRSVLDNFTPPLAPLQALARGDKRMARELSSTVRVLAL
jgi:hypothetical protein